MGESDCRSNKQRNKISRVMDAERGKNRALWYMVMGREDMGTERERIPGRISDLQKAWKTFLAWFIQDTCD